MSIHYVFSFLGFLLAARLCLPAPTPFYHAEEVKGNPTNIILEATFQDDGTNKGVIGHVQFYSSSGDGTVTQGYFTRLPSNTVSTTTIKVFSYQIHESPVGDNDKGCNTTGLLFNPFQAPAHGPFPGDKSCVLVGALSGKHGALNMTKSVQGFSYTDPFLELDPSSPNFIGNKSLNVIDENGVIVACSTIRYPWDTSIRHATAPDATMSKSEDSPTVIDMESKVVDLIGISKAVANQLGKELWWIIISMLQLQFILLCQMISLTCVNKVGKMWGYTIDKHITYGSVDEKLKAEATAAATTAATTAATAAALAAGQHRNGDNGDGARGHNVREDNVREDEVENPPVLF